MPEQSEPFNEPAAEQRGGFASPRAEQLLFACGGYLVAQLIAWMVFSEPGDGEFLISGFAGAFIGIVAHVLIRGVGVKVPGLGQRFRMPVPKLHKPSAGKKKDSSTGSKRSSRYRAALSAFRRPFERRDGRSEAPGNEEKIVKTPEGYRVGDRVFSRRAEAEDYLYVGASSAPDDAK